MRLLHTSDWHVGRTFHGQDLLADQEQVLAALADLVADHRVDVVLVAGDLYDRAVPSAESVQVATRALQRIRRAGAQIVAISGNHDSAPRLGAFSSFLAAGGLYLGTSVRDIANPVLLADDAGPVALYPIPYLEPEIVRHGLGLPGPASHQAVLAVAMDLVRSDLAARPAGTRSVVLAHAFVVGAVPGGSERSIAVGGVESVTGEVFDGIDYVALGHLHTAQVLSNRMRYSGSPLAYSFGEAGRTKGVWLVDLANDGALAAERLDLPAVRPLATVRGRLQEILDNRRDLADHYLAAELTDEVRPVDPMRRVREVFPFALTVSWQPPAGSALPAYPISSEGSSDQAVIASFLTECRGETATAAEQELLDRALAQPRVGAARR